jgi:hypothetical protein
LIDIHLCQPEKRCDYAHQNSLREVSNIDLNIKWLEKFRGRIRVGQRDWGRVQWRQVVMNE